MEITETLHWLEQYDAQLVWLGILSVLMFLGTLVMVPILVVRIPRDYFVHESRRRPLWADYHPILRLLLLGLKNLVGTVLALAGLVMLVLPGQGLVTLLIGVMLLDFPGKFRLERWIVEREPVFRAINWLRQRSGKPPLAL